MTSEETKIRLATAKDCLDHLEKILQARKMVKDEFIKKTWDLLDAVTQYSL